jgi:hypothetical protein
MSSPLKWIALTYPISPIRLDDPGPLQWFDLFAHDARAMDAPGK